MAGDAGVLDRPPVPRLLGGLRGCGLFEPGPLVIGRAPGRLDVMGGIADYSGSLVCELPLAVAVAVAGQGRADGRVICHSRQMGQTVSVELAQLDAGEPEAIRALLTDAEAWARYPLGCVWWLMRQGARFEGLSLLIDSDVPLGGGVASSAALEVATMDVLCALSGRPSAPLPLAVACQTVENRVVGAPCGVMDQVTAVLGRADGLLVLLCQRGADGLPVQVQGHVPVPAGCALVGIHSGVRHEVSGDPYTDTRVAAFMGQRILGTLGHDSGGHLANVDADAYETTLRAQLPEQLNGIAFTAQFGTTHDPVTTVVDDRTYHVRAATDHHVREMQRVQRFVELLRGATDGGDASALRQAGALMYASHTSYGCCARLGHAMTDRLVAMVAVLGTDAGFYGAKITGGGCGGTVAVLMRAEPETRTRLEALCRRYTQEIGRDTILFDAGGDGAAATPPQWIDLAEVP